MSTTVSENPTVQQNYLMQAALSAAVIQALRELMAALSPTDSLDEFTAILAELVGDFSAASAAASVDLYAALRADHMPGFYRPPVVEVPSLEQVTANVEWAIGFDDPDEMRKRMEATTAKMVADTGRAQVVAAVAGDENALGFARVARPGACSWCLALAFRDVLYKSRHAAGQLPPGSGEVNRYHLRCKCTVEPIFSKDQELAPHIAEAKALYADATEHAKKGDRMNAFRRALYAIRAGREPKFATAGDELPSTGTPGDQLAELLDLLRPAA